MKSHLFNSLPLLIPIILLQHTVSKTDPSPLADFSPEWNDSRFLKCNTAAQSSYLSDEEKKLVYILNLLHADPKLFTNTVVAKYPEFVNKPSLKKAPEYQSLLDTLKKIGPLPLVYPDSLCFESAKCHAITAGQKGYVGHERQTDDCKAKKHHEGECCQYGYSEALAVVMALIIDQGVSSLGHRFLCLSAYSRIGVSMQPHKTYGTNTVLDFGY